MNSSSAHTLGAVAAFEVRGPTVYTLWDNVGPIYVGQTSQILTRIQHHLRDTTMGPLVVRVTSVSCADKADMDIKERRTIHALHPRFNKQCLLCPPKESHHQTAEIRTLAQRLCELRAAAGLSTREAGGRNTVSRSRLYKIEQGTAVAGVGDVLVLCHRYGADPSTTDELYALAIHARPSASRQRKGTP